MDRLLTTDQLTKQFHAQNAVDHVNIHVMQGDIYGLIGRNGAGKTTLMRMLARLAAPTSGSFSLQDGADGKTPGRVSALIDSAGIYADLSARDNLHAKCLALGIHDIRTETKLLELVGLSATDKKHAGKFSLGMRQRLGIALALVGNPDLVILDEPTNGLDPQGIADIRGIIERLNQENGITFLISSHILSELSKFATRYGIIHQGRLLEELTREELFAKCEQKIIIQTTEPAMACGILEKFGVKNCTAVDPQTVEINECVDDIAKINRTLAIAGVPIHGLFLYKQELETYFLKLTGGENHA